MVSVLKCAGVFICAAAVILMTAWGALAILYSDLAGGYLRAGLAGLFVLATLLAFVFLPGRLRTLAEALPQQALYSYQQTIQNAFREVDDALLIYRTMGGGWVEIAEAKETYQPVMAAGFIPWKLKSSG